MSRKVIVTCAITGGSTKNLAKHPGVPKTPTEIAQASIDAAKAGAAVVHIHVRDPESGEPSNKLELYEQVVKKLRDSSIDVILNLTCGMDGIIELESVAPLKISPRSTLRAATERCLHAVKLQPELATLDCGLLHLGEAIYVARTSDLREMAKLMQDAGVKPELECFDFGHIEIAKQLVKEGTLKGQPLFQFCLSTGYGAPFTPTVLQAMKEVLPPSSIWGGFGCSIDEMPTVAQIVNLGGHIRVGLEDNIYLRRGVLASNADLVENAVGIIERMGASVATPAEAREMLGLVKRG
ncbi:3-keto-5-aminohexanoate cleavage protein [Bradyrhizobium sp. LMG 9283]|uniref:3-keto-5-aminohexanoate cleavage protein n=1 Tax=Bradyrhizobium sp. LMG 9283 TaxID=592064 RepID=UPI00388F70EC